MQSSREAIYAALFAYFNALGPSGSNLFVTTSRRVTKVFDLGPDQTPALYQTQETEVAIKRKWLPTEWHFNVRLYVYVATGADTDTIPSSLLNPLLDAIENALEPDQFASWTQTLGNLPGVYEARLQGPTVISEGVLGTSAIAEVPVEIVVLS